jgi:DNA-binding transcriptional LysR family regulator
MANASSFDVREVVQAVLIRITEEKLEIWPCLAETPYHEGFMAFDGRYLSGAGIFAAAIKAGSFARAGEMLGLTASGVSRAVARLEFRIGVKLFIRQSRGVRLTPEGLAFYERISPAVDQIERVAASIAEYSSICKGHLTVVVDAAFGCHVLASRVGDFLDQYPDVEMTIKCRDRFRDFVEDEAEIAVRFGPPINENLTHEKLFETRVITCASPEYIAQRGEPLAPEELKRPAHECILFHNPASGRAFQWDFHRENTIFSIRAEGRLATDSVSGLVEACVSGRGVAQLLESYSEKLIADGRLLRVLKAWDEERYPLYAFYPSDGPPSARVNAFVQFCTGLQANDKLTG